MDLVNRILVVTQGGALWEAQVGRVVGYGEAKATLTRLNGPSRIIEAGMIGLTESSGVVPFMDTVPLPGYREPGIRPSTQLGWKANTTPIVGVFLQNEHANAWAERWLPQKYEASKPWDPEVSALTQAAIQAIGDTHQWLALDEAVATRFKVPVVKPPVVVNKPVLASAPAQQAGLVGYIDSGDPYFATCSCGRRNDYYPHIVSDGDKKRCGRCGETFTARYRLRAVVNR